MQDPIPTRPANLASTSLRDLFAGYQSHLTPHVSAGLGEPDPVGELRADAPYALLRSRALADRLMAKRRVTVAEALPHGASAVHVANALGLEIDEVAAGRRSRADGQHQHVGMSAAARDEVHPLLDDREAGR